MLSICDLFENIFDYLPFNFRKGALLLIHVYRFAGLSNLQTISMEDTVILSNIILRLDNKIYFEKCRRSTYSHQHKLQYIVNLPWACRWCRTHEDRNVPALLYGVKYVNVIAAPIWLRVCPWINTTKYHYFMSVKCRTMICTSWCFPISLNKE